MKNVTYINASAGSGKTYTLTHKLADLIKDGKVKPQQVIMTTFTVKAANEMKEEAKRVLYEYGLFDEASQLDQALIGTIHSVANSFIKKYWFFMGLSPDMGVMAEEDTQFYISQSLSDLPTKEELQQLHYFCDEMGIQHDFSSDKTGMNYDFWKKDLEEIIAYTTNYEIVDYTRSVEESLKYLKKFVRKDASVNYTPDELRKLLNEHLVFLEGREENATNKRNIKKLQVLKRGVEHPNTAWYKDLYKLLKTPKGGELAQKVCEKLGADLWHTQKIYDFQEAYIKLLFELAQRWKERFSNFKKERNLLDYNDMEKYMNRLLHLPELAQEISGDFRYLFVDEYQDCSPIQVKIFDHLSNLMEHSFWVGDYKQAIYGFRGSDVPLTKAVVERISKGEDGCAMAKPLDTSYRSLPDIVNVCNETFRKTFAGVLHENSIMLNQHRENKENIQSLRVWKLEKDEDGDEGKQARLSCHIAHLIMQGVKPNEIAVLAQKNDYLNKLASYLTEKFNFPVNREGKPVSEMRVTPLILALLALILSDRDSLAKAQIAYLTEAGYNTGTIIDEKILLDNDSDQKKSTFLNEVPLVKKLLELRPLLMQQSVASLVETLIIELDLFNEVKKLPFPEESFSGLRTFIQAGRTFEEHCLQMNLPATINGFIDYITVTDPKGTGQADGIQLHTYWKSKGLQWKYVILTQLCEKQYDPKKFVKKDICGIHFRYAEQPSAENLYPEVYIQAMPKIYGIGNAPDDIQRQIEDTDVFLQVSKENLSEANRLLYVGMTRPQDVLILAIEPHAKTVHDLQWMKDIGLGNVKKYPEPDILGVGIPFQNCTLTPEQQEEVNSYLYQAESDVMRSKRVPYTGEYCTAEPKYVAPSSLHKKGTVLKNYTLGERIPLGNMGDKTMADVGDCIHQIFCGIEQQMNSDSYFTDLIESYGLKGTLTAPQAIRKSWENLTNWLTENHGAAQNIYHERPFTLLQNGQVFTGSIDLVWATQKGNILIDYKTCPLGPKYVLDSTSEHYAGWYAGQLDAYTAALNLAGEKVLKRYIYYPVSGLLCEVGPGK